MIHRAVLICAAPLALASVAWSSVPSDDPADWPVDTTVEYRPVVEDVRFVAPSESLPPEAPTQRSNNNLAIAFHGDRLFFAFRTAPVHFASKKAEMFVVSSTDLGRTWDLEHRIALERDVREPSFVSLGGRLILNYVELGTKPTRFEPRAVWRVERLARREWTAPERFLEAGEIPWDVKVRGGRAWMTSYLGNHYGAWPSRVEVRFSVSDDGIEWRPVDPATPVVYEGGVSEVAIEFDEGGRLWGVTRNEDGDATGFGAHVVTAEADALSRWDFPRRADRERYDSPELLRHGDDLYLIARRDVGGPFDAGWSYLPDQLRKWFVLLAYSVRPKRTSLDRLDRASRRLEAVLDLPSAGDTAFASVARLSAHEFLVANYTSPPERGDWSWIHGQISRKGTGIYFARLRFEPVR